MDEIVVSTDIYLPPAEVYDFLVDFPRYANYSEYLTDVTRDGDGSVGTRYALRFAWWKLAYTAHTEVTDLDPPNRIEWRVVKDLHAHGHWAVERLDSLPDDAPSDAETASRVTFVVEFDANSARGGVLDLPMFVSFDWVIDRVKPKVVDEAQRVVERIVTDLEGRSRPVELRVREGPDTV